MIEICDQQRNHVHSWWSRLVQQLLRIVRTNELLWLVPIGEGLMLSYWIATQEWSVRFAPRSVICDEHAGVCLKFVDISFCSHPFGTNRICLHINSSCSFVLNYISPTCYQVSHSTSTSMVSDKVTDWFELLTSFRILIHILLTNFNTFG